MAPRNGGNPSRTTEHAAFGPCGSKVIFHDFLLTPVSHPHRLAAFSQNHVLSLSLPLSSLL